MLLLVNIFLLAAASLLLSHSELSLAAKKASAIFNLPKDCGNSNYEFSAYKSGFTCKSGRRSYGRDVDALKRHPKYSQRISKGWIVRQGEFPSFASLDIWNLGDYSLTRCAGTLISENLVLTAAHCVPKPEKIVGAQVSLGGNVTTNARFVSSVSKICAPPEWNRNDTETFFRKDVAVLVLEDEAPNDKYISPACLEMERRHNEDAICFNVGHGLRNQSDTTWEEIAAIAVKTCGRDAEYPDDTCYKGVGKEDGNCVGDSGGPVYCLDTCQGSDGVPRTRQVVVAGASHGAELCELENKPFQAADYVTLRDTITELLTRCRSV